MATRTIGIGLLGVGVVGAGVARTILKKGERLLHASGGCIELRNVLVRDLHKSRGIDLLPDLLTTNPQDVLENPEIDIVVEVLGGPEPAKDYIFQAIANGKHVVTANKDVMAKYGPEILEAAVMAPVTLSVLPSTVAPAASKVEEPEMAPATVSVFDGLVVPIPTRPALVIRIFSVGALSSPAV